MIKVTLLGAGSGFTQPLFTDILNIPGLNEGVIGLVDIDPARLAINVRLMRRLLELMGKTKWTLEASTDRRKILKGTDYLISTIEVSGLACVRHDYDIPLKYGIDQCIGDTIGPGGVMKALRTMPPFLDILEDAQRLCPNALIMNYTNPMSIMTLGAVRSTPQPFLGLCHSVQGNSRQIAQILGVPYEELVWQCGGINHMAWFTTLTWRGRDMLPVLRDLAHKPSVIQQFPVRTDLIRNLGFFSTESCGHYSEYVPYYRKRKDLLKKYSGEGYLGESGYYARNWPQWRKALDKTRREMADGKRPIPTGRSHEYASDIIEAHVFDRKKVIYASIPNTGLIPNLPQTGVVEVATLVDARGYMPTYFGNLPEACAALCRSNMAVFELAADGILKKDRESVIQAMMLDPLSAAVCSLSEIRDMAEELFAAEKAYIPAWCAKPRAARPTPTHITTDIGFLRTLYVSRVLPHQSLTEMDFPGSIRSLGLQPRTFDSIFCNRHEELRKAGPALVYYGARFRCSTAMKLIAYLGYDGPVMAWLNGREVFKDPTGTNPARPDAAKIPFQARKGTHEFLVALDSNGGKAWGIYLRFERSGAPLSVQRAPVMPVFDGITPASGATAVSSMSARGH